MQSKFHQNSFIFGDGTKNELSLKNDTSNSGKISGGSVVIVNHSSKKHIYEVGQEHLTGHFCSNSSQTER